jgi:hypothetical protein
MDAMETDNGHVIWIPQPQDELLGGGGAVYGLSRLLKPNYYYFLTN